MNSNEFLWEQKYRPTSVMACVLPKTIKDAFKSFVEAKNIPNLILVGKSGVGKTTVAKAALEELDCDHMIINAALERGIDIIREKMLQFASTVSFKEGRKYIILDEADGMTSVMQDALKAFIEQYSDNVGFIFTCNNLKKIIDPIQSRCSIIEFKISNDVFPELSKQFYNRLMKILDKESITYQNVVLVEIIKRFYPDWRKIIITVQKYAIGNGKIDTGILGLVADEISDTLVTILKNKEWNAMRRWAGESFYEFNDVSSALIRALDGKIENKSLAILIDLSNTYDYQNFFVSNKELNLVAYLQRVMSDIVWKN